MGGKEMLRTVYWEEQEDTKKRNSEIEGKMMKEGTVKKEEGCGRGGYSFYKGREMSAGQEAA